MLRLPGCGVLSACAAGITLETFLLPNDIHRRAENIARAALGLDELRARRVGLDLAPQAQDRDVDRAVVDLRVVHAREVEQLVAAQDALRRREERGEDAELAVGEVHRLGPGALHAWSCEGSA